MLVFWWQGRGYLTLLIVVAATILTGIGADALHAPSYTSEFWAVVFFVSAPVNWVAGRYLNAKRRKTFGFLSLWKQLTYKARHKFMSLPMETWSVAMLVVAVGAALQGVLIR